MTLGQEIEMVRIKCGMTDVDVFNALNITAAQYHLLKTGRYKPTVFQLICFISATNHYLDSLIY